MVEIAAGGGDGDGEPFALQPVGCEAVMDVALGQPPVVDVDVVLKLVRAARTAGLVVAETGLGVERAADLHDAGPRRVRDEVEEAVLDLVVVGLGEGEGCSEIMQTFRGLADRKSFRLREPVEKAGAAGDGGSLLADRVGPLVAPTVRRVLAGATAGTQSVLLVLIRGEVGVRLIRPAPVAPLSESLTSWSRRRSRRRVGIGARSRVLLA